jgi:glutaredoxin
MWVMITRDQCNFCSDAKALLRGHGFPFTEYNVQSPSSRWILSLIKLTDIKTVPQIFKPDGTLLGGYTELKEYLNEVREV